MNMGDTDKNRTWKRTVRKRELEQEKRVGTPEVDEGRGKRGMRRGREEKKREKRREKGKEGISHGKEKRAGKGKVEQGALWAVASRPT